MRRRFPAKPSNLRAYSSTAASPRWRTASRIGPTTASASVSRAALRASKPPIKCVWQTSVLTGAPVRVYDLDDAKTAYLWRMAAFTLSPYPAHGCLPVCAAMDLPVYGAERRALADYLDTLVDRVVQTVPKAQWHGTARWAQAYGL